MSTKGSHTKDGSAQQTVSRRTFARRVAGGSLVVGFNILTGSWVTSAGAARGAPFEQLPPLDGTLSIDGATRRTYAQDYGQIVHEQPLAVLLPGSVEDITRMVHFARRFGLRIAARGQGHQASGQAQIAGGVVIDMRSLRTVHSVTADGVDVDAGADWRRVVEATVGHGLTPPVLTAYLGLTVGGTLSIGGVGTTTFRYGAQVDHVLELQVVTGEGEMVTCSETHHRDLFEAALAGQGQCGIITRAIVRLVPASATVREYVLRYADLPTLLQDGAWLTEDGRFAGVVAVIVQSAGQWSYSLVATGQFTPPDAPDDAALLAGLRHVPGSEQAKTASYLQYVDGIPNVEFGPAHPDAALFIPGSASAPFIGEMLQRLTPDDLGAASAIRVFFWTQGPFARPLFRIPGERTLVYAAMLRTETRDPGAVARMLTGNRALFEKNRDLGGTHYPFGVFELSPRDWRQHYGDAWPVLLRAKRRYDPDRILASGPDLFRAHRPGG